MAKNYNKITLTLDEVGSFLAKLTENSEHVYWMSSPDFKKIQYISPSYERIWGRSREELYNNPEIWITFLHPDDAIDHHPIHEMANKIVQFGDKARYSEQYRIIRPNGEIRWIMDNGFPIYNDKGVCFGVTGIAIDVTEQKKQEEELRIAKVIAEKANHAKDEFIQNMSHDIRTPLIGIIGVAALLEQEAQKRQEKDYAQMIQMSGEQLLGLFNSILDIVSTSSSKEQVIDAQSFDLHELVKGICELELPTVKVKKLELHLTVDSSAPQWIITDSVKLHRIILNLLSNAIKFTKEGAVKINIAANPLDTGHIELEMMISDSGIGIPIEDQDMIFDRFYRVTPSSKGLYKGHGVGLHIVQKYVELLNGTIAFESNLKQGTQFIVKIPVLIDSDRAKLKPDSGLVPLASKLKLEEHWINHLTPDLTQGENSRPPLLLLVEDNAIGLKMVESVAKEAKCRYMSAYSGEEALDLIQSHQFDLILSDLGLPGISGSELTLAIRAYEQKENKKMVPIVGLTAHAIDAVTKECLSVGMTNVVIKPIKLNTLQNLIAELISTKNHLAPHLSPYLGPNLPASEDELFKLEPYPLLDEKNGMINLGDFATLKELLQLMITDALPQALKAMDQAYAHKNWTQVEQLAKKMKTEALYCGAIRLKFACQYLELCFKEESSPLVEALYKQFSTVVTQTILVLLEWLANNP
ncbi:histidine kinase [Legionella antarctica]|uniref:histidine kinase n=1 Tax=Legionella antarctica TaxID=2708020 RepID=A0A6F8T086_9GAMM|nr:PAS domain-containing hybrid sensor histidine kinase/response regulator [Legionella antarctica]BCA93849.1 histidine kinase [Legionella antarctica]